jgi:hypothetical protein
MFGKNLRAGPPRASPCSAWQSLSHSCRKERRVGRFCRLYQFITSLPSMLYLKIAPGPEKVIGSIPIRFTKHPPQMSKLHGACNLLCGAFGVLVSIKNALINATLRSGPFCNDILSSVSMELTISLHVFRISCISTSVVVAVRE